MSEFIKYQQTNEIATPFKSYSDDAIKEFSIKRINQCKNCIKQKDAIPILMEYISFLDGYCGNEQYRQKHLFILRKHFHIIFSVIEKLNLFEKIVSDLTAIVETLAVVKSVKFPFRKEYLKFYCKCLIATKTGTIRQLIKKKRYILNQLFDNVVKCAVDAEDQIVTLEIIVRLYSSTKKVVFFEKFLMAHNLTSIYLKSPYNGIRNVLTALNQDSPNIFSILCTSIALDLKIIFNVSESDVNTPVYLDVNLKDKMIYFFCNIDLIDMDVKSLINMEIISFCCKDVTNLEIFCNPIDITEIILLITINKQKLNIYSHLTSDNSVQVVFTFRKTCNRLKEFTERILPTVFTQFGPDIGRNVTLIQRVDEQIIDLNNTKQPLDQDSTKEAINQTFSNRSNLSKIKNDNKVTLIEKEGTFKNSKNERCSSRCSKRSFNKSVSVCSYNTSTVEKSYTFEHDAVTAERTFCNSLSGNIFLKKRVDKPNINLNNTKKPLDQDSTKKAINQIFSNRSNLLKIKNDNKVALIQKEENFKISTKERRSSGFSRSSLNKSASACKHTDVKSQNKENEGNKENKSKKQCFGLGLNNVNINRIVETNIDDDVKKVENWLESISDDEILRSKWEDVVLVKSKNQISERASSNKENNEFITLKSNSHTSKVDNLNINTKKPSLDLDVLQEVPELLVNCFRTNLEKPTNSNENELKQQTNNHITSFESKDAKNIEKNDNSKIDLIEQISESSKSNLEKQNGSENNLDIEERPLECANDNTMEENNLNMKKQGISENDILQIIEQFRTSQLTTLNKEPCNQSDCEIISLRSSEILEHLEHVEEVSCSVKNIELSSNLSTKELSIDDSIISDYTILDENKCLLKEQIELHHSESLHECDPEIENETSSMSTNISSQKNDSKDLSTLKNSFATIEFDSKNTSKTSYKSNEINSQTSNRDSIKSQNKSVVNDVDLNDKLSLSNSEKQCTSSNTEQNISVVENNQNLSNIPEISTKRRSLFDLHDLNNFTDFDLYDNRKESFLQDSCAVNRTRKIKNKNKKSTCKKNNLEKDFNFKNTLKRKYEKLQKQKGVFTVKNARKDTAPLFYKIYNEALEEIKQCITKKKTSKAEKLELCNILLKPFDDIVFKKKRINMQTNEIIENCSKLNTGIGNNKNLTPKVHIISNVLMAPAVGRKCLI